MTSCDYLVDTSAVFRLSRNPGIMDVWDHFLDRSLVGYCDITALELIRSVRTDQHYNETVQHLNESFVWVGIPDKAASRSRVVQHELVKKSQHHGPGAVDLIVAATAEAHRLIVLHYDTDFETIAKITGQPTAWVAPRGSVD